ncbi:MAG TPA: YbhN family protein [Mycobacteriales bacterium]|nr:YbhN family protein [Mycobacteriales bacterium]
MTGSRRLLSPLARRALRRSAELAILALVIEYVLLPQFIGQRSQFHRLLALNSPWLLVAVAAELASLVSFALCSRAMLPRHARPSFPRLVRIDLSTVALSHSLPGGSTAGTGLGLRLLSEAGVPLPDAAFAKLAQGFSSAVVLQALLLTALVATLPTHGGSELLGAVTVGGVLLIVLVVMAVVLVRWGRDRLAAVVARVCRWTPFLSDQFGHRLVMSTAASLDAILADRRRLASAALWSTANWMMDALALWASVRAFGHSLSYLSLMVPFGVASTLAWIPLTPSGLGFVEGALVPLLIAFGTPKPAAVLGVVTWRIIAFWLPVPLGAAAYGSLAAFPGRGAVRRTQRAAGAGRQLVVSPPASR